MSASEKYIFSQGVCVEQLGRIYKLSLMLRSRLILMQGNGKELHYKWYCRRKDEEFHERFELIPPKAQDAGCFRNGRFLLSEGYGGFQVVNEDQSIIAVSSTAQNSSALRFSLTQIFPYRDSILGFCPYTGKFWSKKTLLLHKK